VLVAQGSGTDASRHSSNVAARTASPYSDIIALAHLGDDEPGAAGTHTPTREAGLSDDGMMPPPTDATKIKCAEAPGSDCGTSAKLDFNEAVKPMDLSPLEWPAPITEADMTGPDAGNSTFQTHPTGCYVSDDMVLAFIPAIVDPTDAPAEEPVVVMGEQPAGVSREEPALVSESDTDINPPTGATSTAPSEENPLLDSTDPTTAGAISGEKPVGEPQAAASGWWDCLHSIGSKVSPSTDHLPSHDNAPL
jgi:hypothetical protein